MRCVNLLFLLSLSPADEATGQQQKKQGSCGSGRSKWCSASLLQTPKQGVYEVDVQNDIHGELSEILDQLEFHELELAEFMGVEHPEPSVLLATPRASRATVAAPGKKRHPAALLTSSEHELAPGSVFTSTFNWIHDQLNGSAFTWTCGKIKSLPNACGFFGGYVGFPFFAIVGVLALAIVAELVITWIEEPETPPQSKAAARADQKKARKERMATAHQGGNLSFAWKVRSFILLIVLLPVEVFIFWETGLLQDTYHAAAPYMVLIIVLGTCFFPACFAICTCAKDIFEAMHERLDELFEAVDKVVHGAEEAWESFEDDVGMGHTDHDEGDMSKGAASQPAAAVPSTGKKNKSCC